MGPCEPQKAAPHAAEAHVGFRKTSTALFVTVASFPSADGAESILQNERASLASCGAGSGVAQLDLSPFGDDSFGYTQRIGDQVAAIVLVRVGSRVLNIDYVDKGGSVDRAAVDVLLKMAVDKVGAQ